SLRATAPIIALSLRISAHPAGLTTTRFFRKSVPALLGRCRRCLAGDANPTGGKYGAIRAVTRRLKHPDTGREIGGGCFFVNATGIFTRSLGAARFLPLPSPGRLGECPRRSRAGAWSPNRRMAGQIHPAFALLRRRGRPVA